MTSRPCQLGPPHDR